MKITEMLKNTKSQQFSFSFEVTPDLNTEVLESLDMEPRFYSITWHAKLHLCKDLEIPPLKLARVLRKKQKCVMMHLSCDHMRQNYLDDVLSLLEVIGVCNLFVVLGDGYDSHSSDFPSTKDMVSYIRKNTGDLFCIGVAGFSGSTESFNKLKEKIDSGADFIVTQAYFEVLDFNHFVKECENIGIRAPILPGLFIFEKQAQLNSFQNLTKVKLSKEFLDRVGEAEKDVSISEPGLSILKSLLKDLTAVAATHWHFFTLNKLDKVAIFIKSLKTTNQE